MRLPTLTRDAYIPKDAKLFFYDEELGVTIYHYELANGKPVAIAFRGRAQKPAYHISYSTPERRELAGKEWIMAVQADVKFKKEQAEKRNAMHTLKVGDVLYTSWGYEQTNVDFFEVVEVKGKTVTLREIAAEKVEATGWASDTVVAVPGHYLANREPLKKRPNGYNRIHLTRYSSLSPWDGKPKHRSWCA